MSEVEVLKEQLAEALRKIEHYQEMVKALEKVNKCHEENEENRRKHPTSIFDKVPTRVDALQMYKDMTNPNIYGYDESLPKTLTKKQEASLVLCVKEEFDIRSEIETAIRDAIYEWRSEEECTPSD
jgi:hypothetical protein